MNTFRSGFLDNIEKDYLDAYPKISKIVALVGSHPKVAEYVASERAVRTKTRSEATNIIASSLRSSFGSVPLSLL